MLTSIETSSPPFIVTQQKAAEELKQRMSGSATGRMIDMAAAHSGIEKRHIIIPDADKDSTEKFYTSEAGYLKPDTQSRMNEYEKWTKILTKEAVQKIFNSNEIKPEQIDKLVTISCTGFYAPGFDYHIINEFNLNLSIKRTHIGFMGCAASLIGVNNVYETMNSSINGHQNTLLISIELCSIHLQTEASRDNILANMIFADGCAAALFSMQKEKSNSGLKIQNSFSFLFRDSQYFMGWKIGNYGFEMTLSPELPKIILNNASPVLKNYLNQCGLKISDIKHWALHPGGRAILDSLQNGLELSDEQMIPSREVLRDFGNMSSASILYVLKNIQDKKIIKTGDYCCAVAFGPGLTMEVVLFQGV
ncbi:MAG: type III polyketide synthase [Ignavibacteriales bacterium]|nr:MAG: type III polyketide synthase [Ignavibacteriales bacterium]